MHVERRRAHPRRGRDVAGRGAVEAPGRERLHRGPGQPGPGVGLLREQRGGRGGRTHERHGKQALSHSTRPRRRGGRGGTVKGLAGKVAIVTGASRGIGLGIAQRLVDEGARVCLTARKPEALDEAVAALGGPDHAIAVAGQGRRPRAPRRRRTPHHRDVRQPRPPGQQRRDQPGRRSADRDRPRRGPQDRRGQRARRARLGAGGAPRLDGRARRRDRQHLLGLRREARAGHRDVRRLQGDADQPHRVARRRARPDDPRQRGRARGREDRSSPACSSRAARRRSPAPTRSSGSACPRTSPARSRSCSPTTPRG